MSAPEAGDLAPEFALPDETGTLHRLSDQRGRWIVVYFYPADDTPGCTIESCQFRDIDPQIRAASAEVWGISPDGAASHARFREKFDLPFTLLSDEEHLVSTLYGAWRLRSLYGKESMGIQRSTFLVDPEGLIERAWPKVRADGHATDVLTAIEDARSARAASGR